ncbi:MAG: hypothetical protein Kow0098_15380 [Ignavibacteriaceae bacterium]
MKTKKILTGILIFFSFFIIIGISACHVIIDPYDECECYYYDCNDDPYEDCNSCHYDYYYYKPAEGDDSSAADQLPGATELNSLRLHPQE